MIQPQLTDQLTLLLIAPSSFVESNKISNAVQILEDWGIKVIKSDLLSDPYFQYAGTKAQRVQKLQEALDDPNIDIVLCARGGYGMVQLIDHLDFEGLRRHPKWVIGFSDITALHWALYNEGIKSIHGPMPILFEKNTKVSLDSLKALLMTQKYFQYTQPIGAFDRKGQGQGPLIGGNLSVIQSLIGTDTDIDTNGKILFLEEVHEPLYRIDKMLRHLKRAGKLSALAGLILGSFSDVKPENPPYDQDLYQIVTELTADYDFPIAFDFPIGHEEDNVALVLGQMYALQVKHYTQFSPIM